MYFAPVDIGIIRQTAVISSVQRKLAKNNGLSIPDLTTLCLIHALTKDSIKGVKIGLLCKTEIRVRQSIYLSVQRLLDTGFIERRKRVKTAPFTLYITVQGFELLNSFLLALKKAERLHFGPKPGTEAQAKGGRISRKVKK